KGVGAGRGHCTRPAGSSAATLQLAADPDGILGGQHEGDATAEPVDDGLDRLLWGMAGHGSGIAKAEIDVLMAVDVAEAGARPLGDENREVSRPADHPVHGDAVEQAGLGLLEQRPRARVLGIEALAFAGETGGQTIPVDRAQIGHGGVRGWFRLRTTAIPIAEAAACKPDFAVGAAFGGGAW